MLGLLPACGDDAKTAGDGAVTAGDGSVIRDGGAFEVASLGGAGGSGAGGAGGGSGGGTLIVASQGSWVVFPFTGGDGGASQSPATYIQGSASAYDVGGGKTRFLLQVSGLAPSFEYGAHLHKLPCNDVTMAGGHYQHTPGDAGASDPSAATAMNEVWLDFTTDANGSATKEVTVDFRPRNGEAKAIVVHAMKTGAGGVAGAKLACLNLPF
jgi:hypothetical protein